LTGSDRDGGRSRQTRPGRGSRQLGDRIRKNRIRLGLSQKHLAHRIGRSEGYLLQVENGRTDPSYTDLMEIASVLEIDVVALVSGRQDDAATQSGEQLAAQEHLRRVVSAAARADQQVIDHLRRLLADWRVLEDLIGPRALVPLTLPVCELLDELSPDAPGDVRSALLCCDAEYQQFVGWLCVDLEDHRRARMSYERALARAVQGGRDDLAGYLLACQAEQAIVQGRPDQARSLAQAAQARRRDLTPAVIGWAADLEARTWAAHGDASRCRRKLEEAREQLRASADAGRAAEPSWIYHFTEEAFLVHEGMCLADLGQAQPAIESLDTTIAALDPGRLRDRAYYLSYLAKAHVRAGDPERAARVGQEALGLAGQAGSRRTIGRLDGVCRELRRWRNVQAVHDFSEALRLVGAP